MGVVLRREGAWAVDMEQHGGRPAVPRPLFKMGSGSVERVPKGTLPALHAFLVSGHKACSATSQSFQGILCLSVFRAISQENRTRPQTR